MIDVYKELMAYREVGGDMESRIADISMMHVFRPIAESLLNGEKRQDDLFNQTLFFILMTYTIKSEHIHSGVSWKENKSFILSEVGIPENLHKGYLNLTENALLETVQLYLGYQGNAIYSHLIMLRDLYVQMVMSATAPISDSLSYEQKRKNSIHANDIWGDITQWEQKLNEYYSPVKEGVDDVVRRKKAEGKKTGRKISIRPENVAEELFRLEENNKENFMQTNPVSNDD